MSAAVRRYGWALELLEVRNTFEAMLHGTCSGTTTQAFQAEARKLLPEVDRLLVSREAGAVDRAARLLDGLSTKWNQVRAKALEAASRLKRESDNLLSRGASAPSYLTSILKGTAAGGCLGSMAGCSALGIVGMAVSAKSSGADLGLILGGLAGLAAGALWQGSKSPLKEVFAGMSRLQAEAPDVVATARDLNETEAASGLDPLMAWSRPVDVSGLIAKVAGGLAVVVLALWVLGGLAGLVSGLFSRKASPSAVVPPPQTRPAARAAAPTRPSQPVAAPAGDWTADAARGCGVEPAWIQTGVPAKWVADWERAHLADTQTAGPAGKCTDALSLETFAASVAQERCMMLQTWSRHGISGPCRSRRELQAAGRPVEANDPLTSAEPSVVEAMGGRYPCYSSLKPDEWAQVPAPLQAQLMTVFREHRLAGPCGAEDPAVAAPDPVIFREVLEAEAAVLGGSAKVSREHPGYSGGGYVDGYGYQGLGSTTAFSVELPTSGVYDVTLRYANATGRDMTLSILVGGSRVLQTRLPSRRSWSEWNEKTERLELPAGPTTITYRYGPGDTGNVNLDWVSVFKITGHESPVEAAPATGPTLAGRWVGTAVEGWRRYRMSVTLAPEAGSYSGTVDYPSIPCQTSLTPSQVDGDVHRLVEKVVSGRCVDGFVDMSLQGEELRLEMVNAKSGQTVGSATLTRVR